MFSNISIGQYIPADSILHKLDPRSKIVTTFLMVPAVFLAAYPVQLGLVSMIIGFLVIISRLKLSSYVEAIRPFFFIIIATVFLQLILIKGSVLIDLHLLSISIEGLQTALATAIRLITLIILVSIFTMTTTPGAITTGMGKIMKPLKKLGFPVHELVMIIAISLRFIPIFIEETNRIKKAQMCRGAALLDGSLLQRARGIISILVPLFNSCFQRAYDLAQAMESRYYQGREGCSHIYKSKFSLIDYGYILLISAVSIGILIYR